MRRHFRRIVLCSIAVLSACGDAPAPAILATTSTEITFTGSDSCRGCHDVQYSAWQNSHHDLAMQDAHGTTVLGDFDAATFIYFDTETHFLRSGDDFVVRTENADGDLQDFRVAYAFGVTPLQQYLVEFPDGRMQALPFAWDSRESEQGGQRWFHLYPDEYIGPGDPLHWTAREQNWNYQCAECHSTDVDVNYDLENDRFATTWSEIDVGCEACHGPGSRHVENAQAGTVSSTSGLQVDLDDHGRALWQMNLETGIAERSQLAIRPPQQPESCGRCHARRGVITAEYEYGKPLADTHRPALLTAPLYFSDGQIRDEVYVYGSFLQSRMYRAGVTCGDCHNPHSLQLVTGDEVDAVCAQCHLPDKFASADHHRHTSADVTCVDCHMPSRVYMGVDARHDHSLRIPRPDLSLIDATPNACNECHKDQGVQWAAEHTLNWWGGTESQSPADVPGITRATALAMREPPLNQTDLAAIARALGNGDPLLRMAALQAARGLPAEPLLQLVPAALHDPVRSVRLDAVSALAPFMGNLPPQFHAAFVAAAEEFRAAQLAIASRPEAHAVLGEFEASLGNIDLALTHLRRGLQMEPDFAALRHSLGLVLVRAGRTEDALVELREAARLAPDVGRFTYVLAVGLNSLGQFDEALRVLDAAMQRFPDDFDIAWAAATMLRDHGDIDRATAIAERLATQYPDNRNVAALLDSLIVN